MLIGIEDGFEPTPAAKGCVMHSAIVLKVDLPKLVMIWDKAHLFA